MANAAPSKRRGRISELRWPLILGIRFIKSNAPRYSEPHYVSMTIARPLMSFDEKRIDAIFSDLDQCNLPGASVGIALDGVPLYRKGFGLASMDLPIALSPSMRMRIYSTTKHFTCLAYLLLCEQGQAGIDDCIGKYLPELHPVTHEVTIRQLMGNVSGLRDAHDISLQFSGTGHRVASADLLSLYRNIDDVNETPGTAWIYNNGGFLILTSVIEKITQKPLESFLRDRIFAPVGMYDTLLCRFDSDFVRNSATMHTANSGGGFEKSYLGTAWAGEGGMLSTIDDMLRWLAHMHSPHVGDAATWKMMKTPQRLANGASTGYGLGLLIGLYRGLGILHHGGGGMGANSQMLKVPAAGLDVVVMVNRDDISADERVSRILDACFPNLQASEAVPRRPFRVGTYQSPATGRVIEFLEKDGAQIVSIDGWDISVVVSDSGSLRPAGPVAYLKQEITLFGKGECPGGVRFEDFGQLDDLLPVPPPVSAGAKEIVGRYQSDRTDSCATIVDSDNGLRLKIQGRFGLAEFMLEFLGESVCRARTINGMPWGGILSFDADFSMFRFSNYRTRRLVFQRNGQEGITRCPTTSRAS